jgi:glutaconate CoA-transferase, subunit A
MSDDFPISGIDDLVARVPDGCKVAICKTETGPAMTLTRAMIRRGVRDLHLVCVPTSGLQADLLIGAGCVGTVESAGITLGELGQAPCFGRAVRDGRIKLLDATCPAIYGGLQAAEKGIPFMPIRGLIGSDIVTHHSGMKVVKNPFAENAPDPIVVIKTIKPDVALIHAPLADREGNVWIGRHRGLMLMAHAARETLVTIERIVEGNLLDDMDKGPATIPSLYITAMAEARHGAWPMALTGEYDEEMPHLIRYAKMAATAEGFAQYLSEYVNERHVAAE